MSLLPLRDLKAIGSGHGRFSIGPGGSHGHPLWVHLSLSHIPLYGLLILFTNILIASFFVTSADSATYVIGRYSTAGREPKNKGAEKRLIIFWGTIRGGLAIVGAFPFLIIMYILFTDSAFGQEINLPFMWE